MKKSESYRINGFEQIKLFYSWVFNNQDKNINSTHVSLYLFLINQNNRNNWVEWFKCPYDLGMQGSCIGSRNTYYKCLAELESWGLLEYKKGVNNYKAPLIKLRLLKNEQVSEQATVPLSEQVVVPLSEPLPEHIYKLITNNLQLITIHFAEIAKFIKDLKKKETNPNERWAFIDKIINIFVEEHGSYEVMTIGMERKMAAKILIKYKGKYPKSSSEETLNGLRDYFKRCINIEDAWLHDNMSLSTIVSKFNVINKILTNGKFKKGATANEIADAITETFATDYGLSNKEHEENQRVVSNIGTRVL